jgi:xylulokinase
VTGSRRAGVPLLAAVDVGTTGARAAAFDLDGRLVAEVRRGYQTSAPQVGWAEQDAREWADGAVSAVAGLGGRVGRRGRILAIGLTGQCPTVVAVDARCRPLAPGMLYRDNRAVAEAAQIAGLLGEAAMHRRTGHRPEAFHIGPKVLWLRAHRPDVFRRTARFLQPRDVVLHRLTGEVLTDETHANATLLFDLRRRAWDAQLLDAFELDPALFPPAVPSWTAVAGLSRRAAGETDLPAGLPVVIGAADSQCAAFGAGVVDPGPVSEMAGASSCLNSAVTTPLRDRRVTHYSHVVPDRFCTELGLNTTGAAITWSVRRLGFSGYAELAAAARRHRARIGRRATPPVDDAPLFLPFLGDGERDDPGARAALLGMSDRHTRTAIAFAVLEGIALGVCEALAVLEGAGSPVDELRVGGGGAHLDVLGRIKADALGRTVRHLEVDPAAMGAAMLAGEAAGAGAEARAAIAGAVRRAQRFEPSPALQAYEAARRDWFEQVRPAAAVHTHAVAPARRDARR